jgi:hypothetical protein
MRQQRSSAITPQQEQGVPGRRAAGRRRIGAWIQHSASASRQRRLCASPLRRRNHLPGHPQPVVHAPAGPPWSTHAQSRDSRASQPARPAACAQSSHSSWRCACMRVAAHEFRSRDLRAPHASTPPASAGRRAGTPRTPVELAGHVLRAAIAAPPARSSGSPGGSGGGFGSGRRIDQHLRSRPPDRPHPEGAERKARLRRQRRHPDAGRAVRAGTRPATVAAALAPARRSRTSGLRCVASSTARPMP